MTISLAMIVGEVGKPFYRLLENIKDSVDEIVISTPTGKEKIEGVKVYKQPKECFVPITNEDREFFKEFGIETNQEHVFNFALARNHIFSKATKEWVLWLDDDDIIDDPDLIKPLLKEASPEVMAIEVNYAYHLDRYGRSLVDHWRNRFIRRTSDFEWKGGKKGYIHEDLLSDNPNTPVVKTYDFQVLHLHDLNKRQDKRVRNVVACLKEVRETTPHVDPRTMYYLGISLFDLGDNEGAKSVLREYIKHSGWDEQRYDAWQWIGKKSSGEERLNAHLEAIKERPDWPMAYFSVAEEYLNQGLYEKALEFYKMGFSKPVPDLRLGINPRFLDVHQYRGIAEALLNTGKPKEAIKYLEKALKFYPEDTEALEYIKLCQEIDEQMTCQRGYKHIAKYLEKHNEVEKIRELLKSVPKNLDDAPVTVGIRNKYFYRDHENNEITIYCPASWEEWGPWSLTEGGIGGSEEAVIKLSKHLTDLGWKVTVYANPGERRGEYDGVLYLNADEINKNDNFNILVVWRAPYAYDEPWSAKKKYLWLHDVHEQKDFTKRRLQNLDKVIVLSKYHRSLFSNIPEEKIFYSSNGIDPFDYEGKAKRNHYKLIYTSCPSRGLEYLLDWWPEIRKAVPKAELHVFYGFKNYIEGWKDDPKKMAWKDRMLEKIKQDGIIFHDRQPQDVIRQHSLEAGIWAYPTHFPEISCITAMKMQACGAIPITTGYAALEETQVFGYKGDNVKDELINTLKSGLPNNSEMVKYARENFSWRKVAEQWGKEFE